MFRLSNAALLRRTVGKETAKVLVQHNATVYIACRSLEKAKAAAEHIKTATGKNGIHILQMDLSNLPTVKIGVDEFLKSVYSKFTVSTFGISESFSLLPNYSFSTRNESRLDVLFNSAGVMVSPKELLTTHGHDLEFGTSVLGHFYLTQLLLPTLISSVKSSSDQHVRVVNVTSEMHRVAPTPKNGGPIIYDALVDGPARRKFTSARIYAQSKAASTLLLINDGM